MDAFENFDADFNRMRKLVMGFIMTVLVVMVLGFISIVVIGIFSAKEINEKGLKGVIERVWNGKTPNSSAVTNNKE